MSLSNSQLLILYNDNRQKILKEYCCRVVIYLPWEKFKYYLLAIN